MSKDYIRDSLTCGRNYVASVQRHTRAHRWLTATLLVCTSLVYYVLIDRCDFWADYFLFEVKHDLHGLLYLLPFAYAACTLGIFGATAIWIVGFLAALPRIMYYSIGPNAEIHNGLFMGVPFFVVITILIEMRWREQHAQIAAERLRERKLHMDHVFRAQEHERHRIAQGLHDDVLQRLAAIAVLSGSLEEEGDHSSVARVAEVIRTESVRLAEDLRRLSYDLRPSILDSLGLIPAVDWLSQRLQEETDIKVTVFTKGHILRLSPTAETKVFRLVQEAINNIRQHSRATQAAISLSFSSRLLIVTISDDGRGFAPHQAMLQAAERGHLGLLGMRERVESMGGTFKVNSHSGVGTTIVAQVPIVDTDHQALTADEDLGHR